MIDEHNVVAVSRFDGDAYKSSQAAELTLNAAILRADIAGSYEDRRARAEGHIVRTTRNSAFPLIMRA
jgi:hypothetical protein